MIIIFILSYLKYPIFIKIKAIKPCRLIQVKTSQYSTLIRINMKGNPIPTDQASLLQVQEHPSNTEKVDQVT